jgi:hypothetical protein
MPRKPTLDNSKIRRSPSNFYSVYDAIQLIGGRKNPHDCWLRLKLANPNLIEGTSSELVRGKDLLVADRAHCLKILSKVGKPVSVDRHPNRECLIGKVYGDLTVSKNLGLKPAGAGECRFWECECSCGGKIETRTRYLHRKYRPIRSCGHDRVVKLLIVPKPKVVPEVIEALPKQVTPEFLKWIRSEYDGIKARCTDENHRYYHIFGGSGIKLAWADQQSFEDYVVDKLGVDDIGTKIIRINKYDNFKPGNIKWASKIEKF